MTGSSGYSSERRSTPAKASDDEAIPFEQAVKEIESGWD